MTLEQKLSKKKSVTKVTGVSMQEDQFNQLEALQEYYGVNRSQVVCALVEQEHERLVKARKL